MNSETLALKNAWVGGGGRIRNPDRSRGCKIDSLSRKFCGRVGANRSSHRNGRGTDPIPYNQQIENGRVSGIQEPNRQER